MAGPQDEILRRLEELVAEHFATPGFGPDTVTAQTISSSLKRALEAGASEDELRRLITNSDATKPAALFDAVYQRTVGGEEGQRITQQQTEAAAKPPPALGPNAAEAQYYGAAPPIQPSRFGSTNLIDYTPGGRSSVSSASLNLTPFEELRLALGLDGPEYDGIDPSIVFDLADQAGILQDYFPGATSTSGSGNALGYAQLAESQRQFDANFAEGQRQFELQFGLDAKRLGLDEQQYAAQRDEFAKNFAEQQRQFNEQQQLAQSRFGLEQQQAQYQQELGNRQQQLAENRFGFEKQQAAAQQALQNAQFTRDVLRNPSDYIFAAFESRGATPPRGQITHADLINSLQQNPYQAPPTAGAVPGFAEGGSTGGNVVLTGEKGPELVFDNPDGTMDVVPVGKSDGKESRFGNIPGAADGGSYDPRAVQASQNPVDIYNYLGGNGAPNSVSVGDYNYSLGGNGSLQYASPEQTPVTYTPPGGGTALANLGPRSSGTIDIAAIQRDRELGRQIAASGYNPITGFGTPPAGTADTNSRFGNVTQQDIIDRALRFSPPAVSAAVSGNRIPNYRLATDLTLGSLSQLTDSELAALASRLGVVNNRSLADEVFALQQRYGPTGQRAGRFG